MFVTSFTWPQALIQISPILRSLKLYAKSISICLTTPAGVPTGLKRLSIHLRPNSPTKKSSPIWRFKLRLCRTAPSRMLCKDRNESDFPIQTIADAFSLLTELLFTISFVATQAGRPSRTFTERAYISLPAINLAGISLSKQRCYFMRRVDNFN